MRPSGRRAFGGQMRIASFIVALDLIAAILRHLRGKGYSAR
jgi:hypothetical protein